MADPEQGGAAVPIRAGHVALLFRQFASFGSDLTRPYVEQLEARSVSTSSRWWKERLPSSTCGMPRVSPGAAPGESAADIRCVVTSFG